MKPFLYGFQIISNVELNEPTIAYATSITTLETDDRSDILKTDKFNDHHTNDYDFSKLSGTTLTANNAMKDIGLNDDLVGFFCDDYDIVVKIPMTTISKKVKIKRITSFTPKIVL